MTDLNDRSVVVVANRLPVRRDGDEWSISAGGLVTAMRPVVSQTGGAWVGWDGGDGDVPSRVDGLEADLHAVTLDPEAVEAYYDGFSNRTLWPLVHDLLVEPVIDHSWWERYVEVNRAFADRVEQLQPEHDALLWVHDYHLLLLPGLLRSRLPGRRIGFFLHTPFPPPELFVRLPWRVALVDGLLGADVLSFHTRRYRDNFLRTVAWLHGEQAVDGTSVIHEGRRIETVAHGISIDADEFATLATDEGTEQRLAELREQFGDRRVFLGVDRVDTSKGMRHRLQAIQKLLADDPALRKDFVFVQIAVPSREHVDEVQALRDEIEQMVGRINGRFTVPGGDVPVHYLYRSVPRPDLAAYYRLADVMCVTPLKDGMNLVAKEFVVVQDAVDGDGVLLLSEFTGASLELEEAMRCNPFDVDGLAERMAACLDLPVEDRRRRIAAMAARVHEHDVFDWLDRELRAVAGIVESPRDERQQA